MTERVRWESDNSYPQSNMKTELVREASYERFNRQKDIDEGFIWVSTKIVEFPSHDAKSN